MSAMPGRNGRHDLRQNAEINVTPFVDIMLVLLIVMMVAVPVATMAVKLDLPPIQPKATQVKPTFISVLADGRTLISDPVRGQLPTSLSGLAQGLVLSLGPGARRQSILIRADRAVRYGDFMAVVDQLQEDGSTRSR
jgi:biopolymer transport protein ExbD